MLKHLLRFLASVLVGATCLSAQASIVTLDFDDVSQPGGTIVSETYNEDGFRVYSRILPTLSSSAGVSYFQGHYDLWCGLRGVCELLPGFPQYDGTRWLGTDRGGPCNYFDADLNLMFSAGGCQGIIRIDRNGDLFSAMDLVNVFGAWSLTSSKGGVILGSGSQVTFLGDLWQGIEWIDLTIPGSPVGAPLGFDNLRLEVSEPSVLALTLLGLSGLAFSRRRKQRSIR